MEGVGKARKIKTMSKPSKDYQRIINTLDVIAQDEQLAGMEARELVREAMDIIHDYESVIASHSRMVEHYETEAMTIKRQAGVYVCPNCGKRVQVGHSHCHWCGKKVSWDREAYASRDYPHLGNRGGRNQ